MNASCVAVIVVVVQVQFVRDSDRALYAAKGHVQIRHHRRLQLYSLVVQYSTTTMNWLRTHKNTRRLANTFVYCCT